jgi:hypothetical protein
MRRAGDTVPASAILSPTPLLFCNVWAYVSGGWTIDARLAFTMAKVRSGSGTVFKRGRIKVCLPSEYGTSGKVRPVPLAVVRHCVRQACPVTLTRVKYGSERCARS